MTSPCRASTASCDDGATSLMPCSSTSSRALLMISMLSIVFDIPRRSLVACSPINNRNNIVNNIIHLLSLLFQSLVMQPMILCPLLLHSVNRLMNSCSALSSTYLLILFDHPYHPNTVHHIAHVRDRITTNFPQKYLILMSAILCTVYCTKTVFRCF